MQGLFARPGSYEGLVRISNGAAVRQDNTVPDVRGFALKVLGVEGDSALGSGRTDCQDFLFINASRFAFATGIEFLELVVALGRGQGAVVWHMLKRYGLSALGRLAALKKGISKPFSGFATETLHTTNPIACGSYAMKLRLVPTHGQPAKIPLGDPAEDMTVRLRQGDLSYDLQAQFFVSEAETPIENAAQDWSESQAPFLTLARVLLPQQNVDSDVGKSLAERCEKERFDPWRALVVHRPLGSVMRARRAAYFPSAKARGAV
jgi:hypothetical protein